MTLAGADVMANDIITLLLCCTDACLQCLSFYETIMVRVGRAFVCGHSLSRFLHAAFYKKKKKKVLDVRSTADDPFSEEGE